MGDLVEVRIFIFFAQTSGDKIFFPNLHRCKIFFSSIDHERDFFSVQDIFPQVFPCKIFFSLKSVGNHHGWEHCE